MSWHISAKPEGEIADRVLMPGDPLRAKHIAETFLEDAKEYSHIRNMLGFTGVYKGKRVSIQGSGMGMPSMSIYATELIQDYGVKKIIRTGTCGALQTTIHVRDVVMAQATTTDSSMVRNIFTHGMTFAPTGSFSMLERAVQSARDLKVPFHVGNVLSQDRLYDDEIDLTKQGLIKDSHGQGRTAKGQVQEIRGIERSNDEHIKFTSQLDRRNDRC